MEISKIKKKYKDNLVKLKDASSQCEYLMVLGIQKPSDESVKKDRYKIAGCKTVIWIKAKKEGELIHISSESDSLLVRGILKIFEEMYDRRYLWEIKNNPPDFLDFVSNEVIYPEIKNNGLLKCYQILATLNDKSI